MRTVRAVLLGALASLMLTTSTTSIPHKNPLALSPKPTPPATTPTARLTTSRQLEWILQELMRRRGGQTKASKKKDTKEEDDDEEEEEDADEEGEGAKKKEEKSNAEEVEEEDDAFDVDEEEAGDVREEDFNDGALLLNLIKEVKKTPPMSKLFLGSSVAVTSAAWLLNQNRFPKFLLLDWAKTIKKLQLWRPFTTFLFLGEFGVNYFLSMHFMWTYMGHLEKMKCKDPADFLLMIVFGSTALLLGSQVLGLHNHFLGHNLSCFLVYIWSRLYEGQDVNVMGLFNMPAHLLPWFFVLQTLVLEQQLPWSDLLGIMVGHLYQMLYEKKLMKPPTFLSKFFKRKEIRKMYRKHAVGLNL